MSDLALAPHCLGQAASFSLKATHCKRCEYSVQCATKVMTRLNEINKTLDVTDIMRTTQAFLDKHGVHTDSITKGGKTRFMTSASTTFDVAPETIDCAVRAKKIALTILKRGIDMKADIRRGDNNLIGVKPTYLAAIHQALAEQRTLTHESIKTLIRQDRPDCRESAVSNHASWVTQALIAIGVIEKNGDNYELAD